MNLELFCCSGGMTEGFKRAGIRFHVAIDADPDGCDSHERNVGLRPIRIDVRDLIRMARAGWRPDGAVDLVVADPPCAMWSRAGKRGGTADDRCTLEATAELIGILRPRAYPIGNIPGLDDGVNLPVVQRVIGGLARHGYCTADFARLDAADFGVPQHRVRPFWFGHRGGACIRWPVPTHGDPLEVARPHLPGVEPLKPWVTCRDALAHLPIEELGRPVRVRNKPTMHPCSRPDRPAGTIPAKSMPGNGGRVLLANAKHPASRADAPSRTITAKGDGRGAQGACVMIAPPRPHHAMLTGDAPARVITSVRQDDGRLLAWPWDRPATTVCAAIDKIAAPGQKSGHLSPNAVILSEKAAAILQGFPEGWHFAGSTKTSRWSQIGQAMPPALAAAVARSVAAQMGARS